MRIIQIINALTYGGAQVILLDLVKKLHSEGNEVEVIAFRDGPIGKKLRELGCNTHILEENLFDIPAFFQIKKILAHFKPQLVHSHLFRATFWARLACGFNRKIKLITSVHGSETIFFHQAEKLFGHLSDRLIFPSRFLRDWYLNSIKKTPQYLTSIIYPGAQIHEIPVATKENSLTIGTLSRLHPIKGIDRLLQAASILKKRGISFQVLIGGDGKHRNDLAQLAQKLEIADMCNFLGEIQDQKNFLSKLDIFVAASRQEAFGIHACEAMERMIPVVAANIGGLPEIVKDNVTGFLFEPEDIEALADKLEMLLTNDAFREKSGQLSRERAKNCFNRDIAIRKHMEIYSQFCRKKKKVHLAISSVELGGGERLSMGLMKSLKEKGWDVSATCYGNPLAAELLQSGIPCSSASSKCGGIFFAAKLFKNLLQIQPDILSSHLNRASMFSGIIGKFLRIPSVSHVHGLNKFTYYKHSNRLIAVSSAVEKHLLTQGAPAKQVTVIKNCVTQQAENSAATLSENLKIVIVAKLHKNKGHEWALKTILSNKKELSPLEINIIGDGPEKSNLEKLCLKMDPEKTVIFHGFLENPWKIMQKMNVALLPSLGEGIPLSLLEAMSFGIPCIATNVGGIPEIVSNNVNGILIESGNEASLINALKNMRDPQIHGKLSEGAKKEFIRLNDYDEMVNLTEKVFLDLLERQS